LLSREVITGFLDKEEAKHQLSEIKDNTETLRKMVDKRMAERELVNGTQSIQTD
jgi:hypothetical protein